MRGVREPWLKVTTTRTNGWGWGADVAARADKQCLTRAGSFSRRLSSCSRKRRHIMNDICDDKRYLTAERPSMRISMTLLLFITQGVFAHATMREASLQRLSFLYFIVYVSLSSFLFGLLTWPPLEDSHYRTSRNLMSVGLSMIYIMTFQGGTGRSSLWVRWRYRPPNNSVLQS